MDNCFLSSHVALVNSESMIFFFFCSFVGEHFCQAPWYYSDSPSFNNFITIWCMLVILMSSPWDVSQPLGFQPWVFISGNFSFTYSNVFPPSCILFTILTILNIQQWWLHCPLPTFTHFKFFIPFVLIPWNFSRSVFCAPVLVLHSYVSSTFDVSHDPLKILPWYYMFLSLFFPLSLLTPWIIHVVILSLIWPS